jgi:hypothetical protein
MQRSPARLPSGMPGIGLEMDGAMQQAPQPSRQAWGEESIDMATLNGAKETPLSHASPLRFVKSPRPGCDLITQFRRASSD